MAATPSSRNKGFADERYRALIGRLVEARKKAGLSQGALATRLHRHQQFVSRYETGERRLDVVEFLDIAEALEINGLGFLKEVLSESPKS